MSAPAQPAAYGASLAGLIFPLLLAVVSVLGAGGTYHQTFGAFSTTVAGMRIVRTFHSSSAFTARAGPAVVGYLQAYGVPV